jgi:hypothetical protein
MKSRPKSIAVNTFDLPKLLSDTNAVILSNESFTLEIFLKPPIVTA